MKERKRWFLYAAFAAASGVALFSCAPGDQTIHVGQRIHHDDFEYAVTSYHVSKTIGEGKESVAARGVFYIVGFVVENHARRVFHEWDDSIAYIVDDRGNVYENTPWAQKALRRSVRYSLDDSHRTPPGSSDSTLLVFDLPDDVAAPALMVRGETLMGDFFDGGKFRSVKVALW